MSRGQLNPRLVAPRQEIHSHRRLMMVYLGTLSTSDLVVQYRDIAVLTPAVHGLNAQTLSETAFYGSRPKIHSIMQPPL